MNEILIIAIINLFFILCALALEYMHAVNQRKLFDGKINTLQNIKKSTNLEVFLPGLLGTKFKNLFQHKSSTPAKEVQPSLIKQVTPANLALINISLVIIAFNLQRFVGIAWYILAGLFIGIELTAFAFLKGKQVQVREAIEKKLPEILDMMGRVYRVHNDLRVAISEVAEHSPDPIVKQEFRKVAQLSRFGYSIEEALEHLSNEIKSEDLDFVISSIRLNAPVGGNLAYLFEHTAQMLRQRKEASDEINNLMFQSKISATISALLVPVIIVFSFVSSTKYQDALLRNPNGRMIFLFCLVWWFIGVVIIRKNSRISL